jgi:hypothetical protein
MGDKWSRRLHGIGVSDDYGSYMSIMHYETYSNFFITIPNVLFPRYVIMDWTYEVESAYFTQFYTRGYITNYTDLKPLPSNVRDHY